MAALNSLNAALPADEPQPASVCSRLHNEGLRPRTNNNKTGGNRHLDPASGTQTGIWPTHAILEGVEVWRGAVAVVTVLTLGTPLTVGEGTQGGTPRDTEIISIVLDNPVRSFSVTRLWAR